MERPKNNRVVEILMKRDGISEEDALATLAACRHKAHDAICRGWEWEVIEGIISEELGLEMDYILDIFE